MKKISIITFVMATMVTVSSFACAQDAPAFVVKTYPRQAINAAVQEMNALAGADAALSPKVRELIALGVAAQIPCVYCIYFHTKAAKVFGASEAELREALAHAAAVRKWSTILNGSMYDQDDWKSEVDAMFSQ
jgi:AhpD family alkylhydroperoxidase